MEHSTTQAYLFVAEYIQDMAKQSLDVIKKVATKAGRVTYIAMAISMPHQVAYILGLAPLTWSKDWAKITTTLESVTLLMGAVGVPVMVDYLILICIQGLSAKAMKTRVKWVAFIAMLFPIGVSGVVNFMAPAPIQIKWLFVVGVAIIPVSQGLFSLFSDGVDFKKMARMEKEILAQVEPPEATIPAQSRRCEPGCTCGRHTPKRRRGRRGRGGKNPVAQIERLEDIAPVSPVPVQ